MLMSSMFEVDVRPQCRDARLYVLAVVIGNTIVAMLLLLQAAARQRLPR
jgi:hypothetical protein